MNASNPIIYVEIPVLDMERAIDFYQTVFGFVLEREILDAYEMAHFAFDGNLSGASGSLVKGDVYKPTRDGVILYFQTNDIDETINNARKFDSEILYPKTINRDLGYIIAEISDSEGNRIALKQLLIF